MALHLFQRGFLDQRALVHAVFKAVAHLGGFDLGGELGHELVVHAFLHIKAVGAHAGLAGVAVLAGQGAFHGAVDVGIVKHDEGRVAAQFERQLLDRGGDCAIRMRPTSVLPVKLMWRTTSLAHSTLPMAMELALSAVRMLSTPAGMPARMASSAAARAVSGVSSAGLMTTGQPAASAGATLRVIMASGKFQGVMAAHTPMGCLQHHQAAVVVELGRVSPLTRLASSANHSTKLAP
jgi:hypothetical protein